MVVEVVGKLEIPYSRHLVLFTGGLQGGGGLRNTGSFTTIRALSSELQGVKDRGGLRCEERVLNVKRVDELARPAMEAEPRGWAEQQKCGTRYSFLGNKGALRYEVVKLGIEKIKKKIWHKKCCSFIDSFCSVFLTGRCHDGFFLSNTPRPPPPHTSPPSPPTVVVFVTRLAND